jgi:hypothetical protein
MKMTAFWDIAPCGLVTDRRFREKAHVCVFLVTVIAESTETGLQFAFLL